MQINSGFWWGIKLGEERREEPWVPQKQFDFPLMFWDRWASVPHEMTFEVNNLIKSEYLLTLESVCFVTKLDPKSFESWMFIWGKAKKFWQNYTILDDNFFGFTVTTLLLSVKMDTVFPKLTKLVGMHLIIINHYSWKAALISEQM